ncbi:hypothetical protein BV22DRAFT_1088031 [Leucogyrophana mollusca]|uniref:Uncharacterized protein n=1 Tax=Leucogyrophana mollusca TaxID=85980 RepID=A0ACB8BLB8_9AGAM|nr:hypothetical protein BV22DRAFT_1088031 [Leucogyrophana mollusca]
MGYLPPSDVEVDPKDLPEPAGSRAPTDPVLLGDSGPYFETYLYYARLQREREVNEAKNNSGDDSHPSASFFARGPDKTSVADKSSIPSGSIDEKPALETSSSLSTSECRAVAGALRTVSWGNVFYLITTDVLGPYSSPWAFAQVGYGPGVACYVVFGALAAYSGLLLWWMFLRLDSDRYPMRTFGDLAARIYGTWFRIVSNFLQGLQLIAVVGFVILGNGQALSQMTNFRICFSVCNVVFALGGMVIAQIRTLQKFGMVANLSIWLNVTTMALTMGAVARTSPNYTASLLPPGPVQTQAINNQPFVPQLTGIMQVVYAYGGAMIFIEFIAEMRRPMDFWKALAVSQVFICFVYMLFGVFIYSYQGQFVVNPANQGISAYGLQTAANAIYLASGLIPASLLSNIAIKSIYNGIFVTALSAPPLTSVRGKYMYALSVPLYWGAAFAIASGIPQFSNISALISAVCIFQFTYTFPPFLILGYCVQADAVAGDREYDVNNPHGGRVDSWRDFSRWKRGCERTNLPMGKRFFFNIWNLLLALACLSCAILGAYSAVKSIVIGFQTTGYASSFGCHSPVDNQ